MDAPSVIVTGLGVGTLTAAPSPVSRVIVTVLPDTAALILVLAEAAE
jgi:hypothetical protein